MGLLQDTRRSRPGRATAGGPGEARLAVSGTGLRSFFDRIVAINLDRRRDRWRALRHQLDEIDWPFCPVQRFAAVDGRCSQPPKGWGVGPGAWGCLQSHVRVLADALRDGVPRLLVLEDDVYFVEGFHDRVARLLATLPEPWDQLYLGGQIGDAASRGAPPTAATAWFRPRAVYRTHAYAVHGRCLAALHGHLRDQGNTHEEHVDHRMAALHRTGRLRVFAPGEWIAGQRGGMSDVRERPIPARFWNAPRPA